MTNTLDLSKSSRRSEEQHTSWPYRHTGLQFTLYSMSHTYHPIGHLASPVSANHHRRHPSNRKELRSTLWRKSRTLEDGEEPYSTWYIGKDTQEKKTPGSRLGTWNTLKRRLLSFIVAILYAHHLLITLGLSTFARIMMKTLDSSTPSTTLPEQGSLHLHPYQHRHHCSTYPRARRRTCHTTSSPRHLSSLPTITHPKSLDL
jgi:hypothetical protein